MVYVLIEVYNSKYFDLERWYNKDKLHFSSVTMSYLPSEKLTWGTETCSVAADLYASSLTMNLHINTALVKS